MTDVRWMAEIDAWSRWQIAAGMSPATPRIRKSYLRRLAANVAPASLPEVTVDHLADFLAQPHWSPETRKCARTSLRSFFRWALVTGRINVDPAAVLPTVRVSPGLPRPAPEPVLAAALGRADDRDRLMVMLAAYAGLRRAEIAGLHHRDIVGDELHVRGKGGRMRVVPLHPELAAALARNRRGFIFPGNDGGHLSADRVGRIVAGLLGDGWGAHTLRHRFLTRAYQAERDIRAVQQLGGHSKPETTARYTRVPDGALRRAVMAAGPQPEPSTETLAEPSTIAAPKQSTAPLTRDVWRRVLAGEVHGTYCHVWLGLYAAGLTTTEMTSLRRADYIHDERTLLVDGNKARTLRVSTELAYAIDRYMTKIDSQLGVQPQSSWLLTALDGQPMQSGNVRRHCEEHLTAAGLSRRLLGPM